MIFAMLNYWKWIININKDRHVIVVACKNEILNLWQRQGGVVVDVDVDVDACLDINFFKSYL